MIPSVAAELPQDRLGHASCIAQPQVRVSGGREGRDPDRRPRPDPDDVVQHVADGRRQHRPDHLVHLPERGDHAADRAARAPQPGGHAQGAGRGQPGRRERSTPGTAEQPIIGTRQHPDGDPPARRRDEHARRADQARGAQDAESGVVGHRRTSRGCSTVFGNNATDRTGHGHHHDAHAAHHPHPGHHRGRPDDAVGRDRGEHAAARADARRCWASRRSSQRRGRRRGATRPSAGAARRARPAASRRPHRATATGGGASSAQPPGRRAARRRGRAARRREPARRRPAPAGEGRTEAAAGRAGGATPGPEPRRPDGTTGAPEPRPRPADGAARAVGARATASGSRSSSRSRSRTRTQRRLGAVPPALQPGESLQFLAPATEGPFLRERRDEHASSSRSDTAAAARSSSDCRAWAAAEGASGAGDARHVPVPARRARATRGFAFTGASVKDPQARNLPASFQRASGARSSREPTAPPQSARASRWSSSSA